MPSASKGQRCLCTYRQCCNRKDPKTGELGSELNAHNFRIHQQEERNHQWKKTLEGQRLQVQATEAQQNALAAQEALIEEALSCLSINTLPMANLPGNNYRIDQVRQMVAFYTSVMEDIEAQHSVVVNIPKYERERINLTHIYDVLHHLKQVRGFITRTKADALCKITGPLSNDELVLAQHDNCLSTLSTLESQVDAIEPFWLRRFVEHKNELDAQHAQAQLIYDTGSHFLPIMNTSEDVIHLIVFMVVVCHVLLGFSRRGCWWLFKMTKFIVQTMAFVCGQTNEFIQRLVKPIPLDVCHAVKNLNLNAKATIYAACPRCQKLHHSKLENGIPIYREKCNRHRYQSQCDALLVYEKQLKNRTVKVPIKPFVAFELKDWLANMMSWEDMEKEMDSGWKRMSALPNRNMSDVFQASYVRNFKGLDGKHFSETGPSLHAGHYLFSLGFDFFNPYRNLAAGKKVSIGIIAIICLNLPIEMCYKTENIFLAGIIPGPQEPSLDAVNPYFRPIVDEFEELWKGVYMSRTALFELRRLVLCALILIMADLPAARKAGGFVSCAHELFCSLCWCSRTVHTLNNFDYTSWRRRTGDECRAHAQEYHSAEMPGAAQKLVNQTGVHTSEFTQLPYFDPTKNLIIDPMHNLFLGLIKEHFQNIIGGVSPKNGIEDVEEGDGTVDQHVLDINEPNSVAAPALSSTPALNSMALSASDPSTAATSDPYPHAPPMLPIVPTENNALPPSENGTRAVCKLTSWLEKTDYLTLETIDTTVAAFSKLPIPALVYVGKGVGCFPTTMTSGGKDSANPEMRHLTRLDLAKSFVEWNCQRLRSAPSVPPTPELFRRQGKILTPVEMTRLRRDIKAVVKPSWVTAIPTMIGLSGPKLKSDQWRVAGSLYLPITLIRQWTRPRDPTVTPEHKEILDMTMNLFLAVCITTSRVTSEHLAAEFQAHMIKY